MPRFKYNLEERSPFEKVLAIDKGATLPSLEIQVLDGNDPVDLTGATVTFSMQDANGVPKISGAAANLDDAATGKVSYDWAGADVDTDGNFSGQFSIVVAAGTYKIPNGSTQRLIIQIGRVTLAGLPTADGLVALHSASHILGGLDELDGDQVGIDITLPNLTPDTTPVEVSSVKHLGAILKGISDALGAGIASHAASHQDGGSDEINVGALSGLLADAQTALAHAVSHEFGGGDALDLAGLSGLLATAQDPIAHVVRHIVGGIDPFLTTQLIDAICRRLRTTTGPTDLLLGAIADGEFLKRSGTAIVGDTPAGGGGGMSAKHAIGRLYGNGSLSVNLTATLVGDQLIAVPWKLDPSRTYDALFARIHASGSGELRVGVYADLNGDPGALLADSGDLGFTVGMQSGILASFSPSSPDIWLAMRATTALVVRRGAAFFRDGINEIGTDDTVSGLTRFAVLRAIGGGGALPDPFGPIDSFATTFGATPAMWARPGS